MKQIASTIVSTSCKNILVSNSTTIVFANGGPEIIGFSLLTMKEIYKINPKISVQNTTFDEENLYGYTVNKEEQLIIKSINITTGEVQWSTTIDGLELYYIPNAKLKASDTDLMLCFKNKAFLLDKKNGLLKVSKVNTSENHGVFHVGSSFYTKENKNLYQVDQELNYQLLTPSEIRYVASSAGNPYIYYKEKEGITMLNIETQQKKTIKYSPSYVMNIYASPYNPYHLLVTLENMAVAALLNFEDEKVEWINNKSECYGLDALFTKNGIVLSLGSLNYNDSYIYCSIETGEELYNFIPLGPPHAQGQQFAIWDEKLIEIGGEIVNIYELM